MPSKASSSNNFLVSASLDVKLDTSADNLMIDPEILDRTDYEFDGDKFILPVGLERPKKKKGEAEPTNTSKTMKTILRDSGFNPNIGLSESKRIIDQI